MAAQPGIPDEPEVLSGFGPGAQCELWFRQRRLLVRGQAVALGSRALEVLVALAQRPGQLVRKADLMDLVWPDVDVDENNLQVQVSALRRCLGPDVIQTVPGRGYRLVAPAGAAAPREPPPASRLTPLIDRERELGEIQARMERHALVTLVGAGGVGKTLLARHLSAAYPGAGANAACWVDLAAIAETGLLPSAVGLSLGLQPGPGDALSRLAQAAAGLKLLLVLDNAEHLLDELRQVVAALLQQAPGLRLLVTSQVGLGLPGECLYRVAALAVPSPRMPPEQALACGAVRLFAEHAHAVDRHFVLGVHNVGAVAEACRLVDGLPLALELAAAQVPRLGVNGVVLALQGSERLSRIATAGAGRPLRHRSVRATLAWGHSLLDAGAQKVFRRMAVWADSASLAAVLRVVAGPEDDPEQVLDGLFTLVDRSLVEASADDPPRYRLLEIPRAFAREQLRASGEEYGLRARHATVYAEAFEQAFERHFSGELRLDRWEDELESELADGREAWRWALSHAPDLAIVLATTRWLALQNRVLQRLTDEWEATLAAMTAATPPRLRARALWAAARAYGASAPPRACELARQAVAAARQAGGRQELLLALAELAQAAAYAGAAAGAEAQAAVAESAALLSPGSPPLWRYFQLQAARTTCGLADDSHQALQIARQLAVLELAIGQRHPVAQQNLADAELAAGHVDRAIELGEHLLERLEGSHSLAALTVVRLNLAGALLVDPRRAPSDRVLQLLRASWEGSLLYGHKACSADYLACVAVRQGRPRAAGLLLGYADAAYGARGAARQPNERRACDAALDAVQAALGAEEARALLAQGALLADAMAADLAFAATDGHPLQAAGIAPAGPPGPLPATALSDS